MFWSRNNPTDHTIDDDYTPTKGGRTNVDFFIKRDVKFDDTIESFRYTFFLDNRKPLETTWPTSSGQVTRLRFTFFLLERLVEVSELRQAFYVNFT